MDEVTRSLSRPEAGSPFIRTILLKAAFGQLFAFYNG
jgi:hypothetical protein